MESGERVIWVGGSEPGAFDLALPGSVAGLAVTGKHVADQWLAYSSGFTFGVETADHRRLIPVQKDGPNAERILSFAGAHWRLIAVQAPGEEHNGPGALLLAGFSLVTVLVLTGSLAVVKAVSRELSVA